MATVQVNSLDEFISAVAVDGDTVVCPENAVWDANAVYPDGYSGDILVRSSVEGNGTTIKNLRLYGCFLVKGTKWVWFYNLHIIDLIISTNSTGASVGLFEGDIRLRDCRVSAIVNYKCKCIVNHENVSRNDYCAERCSFNVDAAGQFFDFSCAKAARYSRIEIHAPNSTEKPCPPGSAITSEQCEFYLFFPKSNSTLETWRFPGCIFHGEMPGITEGSVSGQWQGDMSLFSMDGMPNFQPYDPVHFVGVTDAQLRDPAYLRSIGFPIAIEG